MIQTRAILAAAYRGKADRSSLHTHSVDTATGRALCNKVKPESLADEEAVDAHEPPTCPTCQTRDPRRKQHAADGPWLLKSLLQF